MKRKLRFLFPLVIASMALSGCFIQIEDAKKEGEQQSGGDDGTANVDSDYYKGYDLTKFGGRLEGELQKLCFDKHTGWITYSQVNSYYSRKQDGDGKLVQNSVEAVSNDSKLNQWFYTGREVTGYGTREHVWPCANSASLWAHGKDSTSIHNVDKETTYCGGGSDLFHVRTCDSKVNTARGNSRFVSFDTPEYSEQKSLTVDVGQTGGKYTIKLLGASKVSEGVYEYANFSEPADEMKGDVARIVLYVYIHYGERGTTPEGTFKYGTNNKYSANYTDVTGSLALSSIMGYSDEERCLEVLKEWNKLDPPSEVEKLRNNTVQAIQGNRNPFVDLPELVDQL